MFHVLFIRLSLLVSTITKRNDTKYIQVNKHKYSMAKDDVVIGLGRPMYGSSVHANRKKAYPSVITTLGNMEKEVRRWIAVHNFMCNSYLDADSMMKEYVIAMCSDKPTGSVKMIEAHKTANIPSDRKNHIKFQVCIAQ